MRTAVVIPCHNQAMFLDDAIDSIFRQQKCEIDEIVVVDDASDDDMSLNLVNSKNEFIATTGFMAPIRHVRTEDRSLWEARKAGFKRTTADVICFLDADDVLPPDYFAKGIQQFEAHGPRCGIVYSDMQEFGDGDKRHSYPATGICKEVIQRGNQFHSGSLVTRRALEMSGAFNARRPLSNWTADWYLWKQVMEAGFSAAKSGAVYQYRKHPASITATHSVMPYYDDANLALEWVAMIVVPGSDSWKGADDWLWHQFWGLTRHFVYCRLADIAKFASHCPCPFALIVPPQCDPPLNVIEVLMREMQAKAAWLDHPSGAALVRRSSLFDYALKKYDESKGA